MAVFDLLFLDDELLIGRPDRQRRACWKTWRCPPVPSRSSRRWPVRARRCWPRSRHFGIPWRMSSRVVELQRPVRFVDEQVRGPLARFWHEHRFDVDDARGMTRMLDVVEFSAPVGAIGWSAERVVLGRYVQGLVQRRNAWLKEQAERSRLRCAFLSFRDRCGGLPNVSRCRPRPPNAGRIATAPTAWPGWPTGPAARTAARRLPVRRSRLRHGGRLWAAPRAAPVPRGCATAAAPSPGSRPASHAARRLAGEC
jgi:hypothetical protein